MKFIPAYCYSATPASTSLCLIFQAGKLYMLKNGEERLIPKLSELPEIIQKEKQFFQLGSLAENNCFFAQKDNDIELSEAFELISLRKLFNCVPPAERNLLNLAFHLYQWEHYLTKSHLCFMVKLNPNLQSKSQFFGVVLKIIVNN